MKEKLVALLHFLSVYDYIYFIGVFFLFILLLLLVLLLRKKATLALLLFLLSILELVGGYTIGFYYFDSYLFGHTITLTKVKRLSFVEAVVIEGSIKNDSKFDFKSCRLEARVYKETHNKYKNLLFRLKPLKKRSLILKDIPKGADSSFKFLIEPFKYKGDINASVSGICR